MRYRYNSNTKALKQREQLNNQGSMYNLENWIISQTKPLPGMNVLDLGCGTGKQIFVLAPIVTKKGSILGIDIASEAIGEVKKRAKQAKLLQIKTKRTNFENCLALFKNQKFDLIVSTYAIYYAKNMPILLINLKKYLKDDGRIFICGNAKGSNQEIIKLVNHLVIKKALKIKPLQDFITRAEIQKIARHFSRSKTVYLKNTIRFYTADDILTWWKNHNTYVPEIDDKMTQVLRLYFTKKKEFLLTKNVLGVHFYA